MNKTPLDLAIEGIRDSMPAIRNEVQKSAANKDIFRATRLHDAAELITEAVRRMCEIATEDKENHTAVAP